MKKEKDKASKDRLAKRTAEIEGLEGQSSEMTAEWQAEKAKLAGATDVKEKLEHARFELQDAVRRGDYALAGKLQHEDIPAMEEQMEKLEEANDDASSLASETVTSETIAAVVSRWTGVPVEKMLEGEREKLLSMEDRFGRARCRARQSRHRRLGCGAPRPRGIARPCPSHWQLSCSSGQRAWVKPN